MKKRIKVLGLGILLATPLPLAAQPAPQEVGLMEEVVVTASRHERQISTVPAHVTIIDEKKIANSTARNIPDLLRNEAGIRVTDTTGNGRAFSVDLRGFGETAGLNTLVLVDGRRINQPDLSGVDWALISLDRVQRIEVVRGGRGSVLYGDNAGGGVINIITKDGGPDQVSGEVAAGSYDTIITRVGATGSRESLSYALAASYADTDGYRDNSASEAADAGLHLRYFPSDRLSFDVSGDFHKDTTGLPGALRLSALAAGTSRKASLNPDDFSKTEDYYLKAGGEVQVLNESSLRLDASFRQRQVDAFATFAGGEFTGETTIDTIALNPRLLLKEPLGNMDNSLIVGIDYQDAEEEISNRSIFFGFPSEGRFDLRKKNYGVYLHDELTPTDNLTLSAGYRYDRVRYSFGDATAERPTFSENLYTAGANYRYAGPSYTYFNYARGFRYPVLDELFNFFTSSVNPDLRPQRSDNYEVGLRHYPANDFYIQANYFHLTGKDEIFYNPVSFSNENLDGKTRRQGVEIAFSKPLAQLTVNGGYTYTRAKIRDGQFAGNDIPGVPAHQATLGLQAPLGQGFSWLLQGNYMGKRYYISDFNNDFSKMDDHLLVNAGVQYHWRQLNAYLHVNNLFDKKYAEYGAMSWDLEQAEFPSPGINFLAGVKVNF